MSGEQVGELPEPLREWVESRAAETGREPTEVLLRAAAAYRLLDENDELLPEPPLTDGSVDAETLAAADGQPALDAASVDGAATDEDLTALTDRVAALESELDEKVDDVRERVIQVKRETDQKAAVDHGHRDLRADTRAASERADEAVETADDAARRADEAAATAETATEEIEALREEFADLDAAVEGGFENYEDVLRGLKDATDDVRSRADRLADVLADLRDRVSAVESTRSLREATATLRREANQKGVTEAVCGSCESTVHLGLLSAPRCPHCEAPYGGVDADTGLFRSARLTIADRPALTDEPRDRPVGGAETEPGTDTEPLDLDRTTESTTDGGTRDL